MQRRDSRFVQSLVVWYGLYQLIHIGINLRGLLQLARGGIDFPALPPPAGWTPQVIHFFTGMAGLDLLNAVLTLVFVTGYFRRARWRWWLGTLTLTISMYAAVLFDYATIASGAWTGANLPGYLFINVTFLPVVWLFGLVCVWGMKGPMTTDSAPETKAGKSTPETRHHPASWLLTSQSLTLRNHAEPTTYCTRPPVANKRAISPMLNPAKWPILKSTHQLHSIFTSPSRRCAILGVKVRTVPAATCRLTHTLSRRYKIMTTARKWTLIIGTGLLVGLLALAGLATAAFAQGPATPWQGWGGMMNGWNQGGWRSPSISPSTYIQLA